MKENTHTRTHIPAEINKIVTYVDSDMTLISHIQRWNHAICRKPSYKSLIILINNRFFFFFFFFFDYPDQ
jgi:hypothetical protein